ARSTVWRRSSTRTCERRPRDRAAERGEEPDGRVEPPRRRHRQEGARRGRQGGGEGARAPARHPVGAGQARLELSEPEESGELDTAPTPTRWPRRGPPTAAAIEGSAPALQPDQSPPVPRTAPIGSRYASVMTASASPVAAGNARSGPRVSPRTVVGVSQPE